MTTSNDDIRAKILRIHYDYGMEEPNSYFDTNILLELLPDIPKNILSMNLLYLKDKGLLTCLYGAGVTYPGNSMITADGVDVVEHPERFGSQISVNNNILSVQSNYGQVAQASQGSVITQNRTYSTFKDLYSLVDSHTELESKEKEEIKRILGGLEKQAEAGVTRVLIEELQKALAKYGWLIGPTLQVLMKHLGLA